MLAAWQAMKAESKAPVPQARGGPVTCSRPGRWRGAPGGLALLAWVLFSQALGSAADAFPWAVPGRIQAFPGNPVLAPGPAGSWDSGALGSLTVLRVDGVWHLYYEAWGVRGHSAADYNSLQIGHATSRDGLNWVKDPANPVLPKGSGGDWDRDGAWDPFVLHEEGVFKMWYGGGMDAHCDWGCAESRDGVHFVKKGRISRLGNVEDCHVVHDCSAGRYYMYYWDRQHEPAGLYRAASTNGMDFNFAHASPVRIQGLKRPGMHKFTQVFWAEGKWRMFFGEFIRPGCQGCRSGIATSTDGLRWTVTNEDLLTGQDLEVFGLGGDVWLMYYGPDGYFDQARCDIRLAVYQGPLGQLDRP